MARIGYARVSSADQDLEIQLAKLKSEGCEIIRAEKVSGLGLVETLPDPEDGRYRLVRLTLKGKAFMERLLRAIG